MTRIRRNTAFAVMEGKSRVRPIALHQETALQIILERIAVIDPGILDELIAVTVAVKVAEKLKQIVRGILEERFGPVPLEVERKLKGVRDPDQLSQLMTEAVICPNIESFCQNCGD